MTHTHRSLRKDKRAVSPAFSTVILTAAGIVMILVAMSYANNILNLRVAENEFTTNKQFMLTAGQQIDDIAWTIGRTQTVTYSSRLGTVNFQRTALTYTFRVQTSSGWETLSLSSDTGILLYNVPVDSYKLGNNGYFQRVPNTADSSFLLADSTASISQVLCEQKVPMPDGAYSRIALVPTMRVLTSTIQGTTYYKFYLPSLENGTSPYTSQSVTLTGGGISKITRSGVNQVELTVSFPKQGLGFDSSFFNFAGTTITLNSASTPKMNANSVVEFYVGTVIVQIGAA